MGDDHHGDAQPGVELGQQGVDPVGGLGVEVALAIMNLLPIPALDGGHVLFTLIEMITGRKPNEKFLEYAQIVGMVLLLGLMLYANGNDFFGWNK